MTMDAETRAYIATILETVAKDGLPQPRDLDGALDAIDTALSINAVDIERQNAMLSYDTLRRMVCAVAKEELGVRGPFVVDYLEALGRASRWAVEHGMGSEPRYEGKSDYTPETIKALEGSILKWSRIATGDSVDQGINNCPLCQMFYDLSCRGCPVDDESGDGCSDTPYDKWCEVRRNGQTAETPEHKDIALEFRSYLVAIRNSI